MLFNFPTDFHHILPSLEGNNYIVSENFYTSPEGFFFFWKPPFPLEFQFSFTLTISILCLSPLPPLLGFAYDLPMVTGDWRGAEVWKYYPLKFNTLNICGAYTMEFADSLSQSATLRHWEDQLRLMNSRSEFLWVWHLWITRTVLWWEQGHDLR